MNSRRHSTSAVTDHINAIEKVSANFIHLVNENNARHRISVCLTPHCLGLRLNTSIGIQNTNSAVQNGQRTLNLDREINVAGCVDDVKAEFCFFFRRAMLSRWRGAIIGPEPHAGGCRRSNCNTPLLLLLHPVHGSITIMHFTNLVRPAGVIENTFSSSCFTCINVRHDAEITITFEGIFACHGSVSYLKRLTSDNARRRGWLLPSCACLHVSLQRCHDC